MSRSFPNLIVSENMHIKGQLYSNNNTITLPNISTTLIGNNTIDTLTNKTLIVPKISTISNTGTLTLPLSTTTLIGNDTVDVLKNKTLEQPIIKLTNGGTLSLPTNTTTLIGNNTNDTLSNKTLQSPTITNGGTIILPSASTTLVGRTTTDTLTNKTITGTTNTIDANNLRNGSTWVVSLSGSAPTTNQILTYDGSNAIWSSTAEIIRTATVDTTNINTTALDTITTVDNTVCLIKSTVLARSGSDSAAGYTMVGVFFNSAGTLSTISNSIVTEFETVNTSSWKSFYSILGKNILISVNGQTAKNITWKSITSIATSN